MIITIARSGDVQPLPTPTGDSMTVEKLKKFCGYKESPTISTPWSAGDKSYATNGFILVIVPRVAEIPERTNTVNIAKVLDMNPMPDEGWEKAPGIDGLNVPECPKCKGKERPSEVCEECDGSGVVDLSNEWHDYECECKSSHGDGEIGGCRTCHGTGYLTDEARIHLAGAEFKTAQILDLTRVFGPLQVAPPSAVGRCSWLRFDGGHALVMPILRTIGVS